MSLADMEFDSKCSLPILLSCWGFSVPGRAKRKRRLDSLEAAQGAPRHTRRDSRGKRNTLLPLETRPDFLGESGMPPRDPCHPWRGIFGPGHKPRYGLFCPAVTRVGSQLTLATLPLIYQGAPAHIKNLKWSRCEAF